jgi:arginine decarboxylase
MSFLIPKKLFLTKGKGFHKHKLQSFELALRDAGISRCNLVKVSSIIPPKCKIINKKEGVSFLKPGEVTFCVLSVCETNNANEEIAAGIGLAYSDNREIFGYIAEGIKKGEESNKLTEYIEETAENMLKTVLIEEQLDFVLNKKSIVQTLKGKEEVWSTAVAAAIFLM